MEISAPLTLFGLIATILSIGFALAAFLNSRRHRGQMTANKATGLEPHQTQPFPRIKRAAEAVLRQEQTNGQPPAEPGPAFFKQIDHSGKTIKMNLPDANDDYMWE